jgi:predicted Zn-dependent protease
VSTGTATYADLLVETGQPAEAAPLFDALIARHPRAPAYLLGAARAAAALEQEEAAAAHYAELTHVWAGADEDLPALREATEFLGRR